MVNIERPSYTQRECRQYLHHGQIIGVVNKIKQLMIEEINREINEKVRVYDITVITYELVMSLRFPET